MNCRSVPPKEKGKAVFVLGIPLSVHLGNLQFSCPFNHSLLFFPLQEHYLQSPSSLFHTFTYSNVNGPISSAAAVALSHEISLVSEFHKTYRYGMSSMSTTAGLEGTGTESRDAVAKARATWVGGAVEAGGEPRVIVVRVIGVVIVAVWVGSEI